MLSVFDSNDTYDPDFWTTGTLAPRGLADRKCPWTAVREAACWFDDVDSGDVADRDWALLPDVATLMGGGNPSVVTDWYAVLKTLQRTAAATQPLLLMLTDRQCEQGIAALFLAAVHVYIDSVLVSEPMGRPLPRFRFATPTGRSRFALLLQLLDVENPAIAAPTFKEVLDALLGWFVRLRHAAAGGGGGRHYVTWQGLAAAFNALPTLEDQYEWTKQNRREIQATATRDKAAHAFYRQVQRAVWLCTKQNDIVPSPHDLKRESKALADTHASSKTGSLDDWVLLELQTFWNALDPARPLWETLLWIMTDYDMLAIPTPMDPMDGDQMWTIQVGNASMRGKSVIWDTEWENRNESKIPEVALWLMTNALPLGTMCQGLLMGTKWHGSPKWERHFYDMVAFVCNHMDVFEYGYADKERETENFVADTFKTGALETAEKHRALYVQTLTFGFAAHGHLWVFSYIREAFPNPAATYPIANGGDVIKQWVSDGNKRIVAARRDLY